MIYRFRLYRPKGRVIKQAITNIIRYAYMAKTEPQRIAFVSNVEELQDQLLEDDD